MGLLSAKNASKKFSRLGTFKENIKHKIMATLKKAKNLDILGQKQQSPLQSS
jgi:hypothetical protein